MSDIPEAAENTRRSRIAHKWSQFLMWNPVLRWMWCQLSCLTREYSEVKYNRFLTGVHELSWMMVCGYGWKFAWKMAMIYWKSHKRTE